jgi:hypothetical protein
MAIRAAVLTDQLTLHAENGTLQRDEAEILADDLLSHAC